MLCLSWSEYLLEPELGMGPSIVLYPSGLSSLCL